MANPRIFYTYLYLREDGTPYYVGKGSKGRAFSFHRRLKRPPRDRVLIQEFPDEEAAFEAEKFLIAFYGRKNLGTGCLVNLTDGGEGPSGAIKSEQWLEKQRNRTDHVYHPLPPEAKQRMIAKLTGRKMSAGFVEKNRLRMLVANPFKGKKHSPETREKMSKAAVARHLANPERVYVLGERGRAVRWGKN